MKRRILKAALPPLIIAAVHLALLLVLARIDTVRELLGTANPSIPLALLLFAFYVLRIVAIFVLPGWMIVRFARAVIENVNGGAGRIKGRTL